MIRWLLDTDHASLQERGHSILLERLTAVPPDEVAVSVVTAEEMLRGRLAILARHRFVVTRNRKDFGRLPDLRIEDWTLVKK